MDLMNLLIDDDKIDYKCYDLLKQKLKDDISFREIISEGLKSGKIRKFDESLWNKIKMQNIRRINSFEDVFVKGANIGYCTPTSLQLSYSLDSCEICGGILPILEGTNNSLDGSHTWISYKNEIIDTTLMLIIQKDYSNKLGYIEENRRNPAIDPRYQATKEWTNDPNIRKQNRKR